MVQNLVGNEIQNDFIGGDNVNVISTAGDGFTLGEEIVANDAEEAEATGIDNSDQRGEVLEDFLVQPNGGDDIIEGIARANSEQGEAVADGVLNTGEIDLNNGGFDTITGRGTASTAANGQETIATGINSTSGGVISGGEAFDGEAIANGQDNVGAFGVLVSDMNTGGGGDLIDGFADAIGVTTTDARGISVGFSDIDDDTIASPQTAGNAPTANGNAEPGQLFTEDGNDVLAGTANVTVNAQDGDEIFFAGANGIVNDDGTLAQLEDLLGQQDFNDLQAIVRGDIDEAAVVERVTAAVQAVLPDLTTSTLDTGAGDDFLDANVNLDVSQDGDGADDDLEVIGDGIENAGDINLGEGNDRIDSIVNVATSVEGAKGLADAIDNSSVGNITGLNLEVNNETVLDLGAGDDSVASTITASAVDDLSAADGLGNRGTFIAGDGNDTFNLNADSDFLLQNENDNEQQEGIADGWENRSQVFLDNPDDLEGEGAGNDSVTTNADAFGNGVLTIAEGLETRELFEAGGGDDTFDLTAIATTGAEALSDNLTQAAGLQTEQITSGEFRLGSGNNSVIGNATTDSAAVAGVDDGVEYQPASFAFGITQMTADANAAGDVGELSAGAGNDTLDGTATAGAVEEASSFGLLFSNANLGDGANVLEGNATTNSGVSSFANGVSVGTDKVSVFDNSVLEDGEFWQFGLEAEAGTLVTGDDNDRIEGTSVANVNADDIVQNDSNGILVEVGSTLNTNDGVDTIIGDGSAGSQGSFVDPENAQDAILIDGIENKGTFNTGAGGDNIIGDGSGFGGGVEVNSGGIDNGRALVEDPEGFTPPVFDTADGNDTLVATAESQSENNAAISDSLSNVGQFLTGAGEDFITSSSIANGFGEAGDRSISDAIDNRDFFATGEDNDRIVATARATATNGRASANAIDQSEGIEGTTINMEGGRDSIIAEAIAESSFGEEDAIAIFGGAIDMGDGGDVIRARSNGAINGVNLTGGQAFGNGVNITMGGGDDLVLGFGDGTVDGGDGNDILQFEFTEAEFLAGGGSRDGDTLTFGDVTLEAVNFEVIQFGAAFEDGDVVDDRAFALEVGDTLLSEALNGTTETAA